MINSFKSKRQEQQQRSFHPIDFSYERIDKEKKKKTKVQKRFWVRQLFKHRKLKGEFHLLNHDMRSRFFKHFRMISHL